MVNIDLGEIRKYNNSLREYQDKSSKIKAEIDFNTSELVRLCEELTAELGVSVTTENIESMYADYANRIKNTLSTGTEILQRIANDEAAIAAGNMAPVSGGANMEANMAGNMAGNAPTPPVMNMGSDLGFGSLGDTTSDQAVLNNLPKMF